MSSSPLRIGTRGSRLALWQAKEVRRRLTVDSRIEIISTSGDRIQDRSLQNQSTTGFFTREIEQRLMDGSVDVAVHSLKDLPTQTAPELELAAFLPRAPVADLLIIHPEWHDPGEPLCLRAQCVVGTGALRRQAQLAQYCPGCRAELIRGNVPTRIDKCRRGDYGAILLARAGVERLGLEMTDLIAYELDPELWLPAPGQGIVAVQCRRVDSRVQSALAELDHEESRTAAAIERALLATFEAGCHSAFGALARPANGLWSVRAGWEEKTGEWHTTELSGSVDAIQSAPRSGFVGKRVSSSRSCIAGVYPR